MNTVDPMEFAEAFQRGEERGFDFFYNSLYGALCYYAYRIIKDKEVSKDKVDESFVKVWERRSAFVHPGQIKSYVYSTVRNACLNYLQQERRRKKHKDIIAQEQVGLFEQPIIHDIIRAEVVAETYKYLSILPKECRKIFQRLYIQGDTVRDIVDDGQNISTVKNQKGRGLKLIRKRFFQKNVLEPIQVPPKPKEIKPPPHSIKLLSEIDPQLDFNKIKIWATKQPDQPKITNTIVQNQPKKRGRKKQFNWEVIHNHSQNMSPKEIAFTLHIPISSVYYVLSAIKNYPEKLAKCG